MQSLQQAADFKDYNYLQNKAEVHKSLPCLSSRVHHSADLRWLQNSLEARIEINLIWKVRFLQKYRHHNLMAVKIIKMIAISITLINITNNNGYFIQNVSHKRLNFQILIHLKRFLYVSYIRKWFKEKYHHQCGINS